MPAHAVEDVLQETFLAVWRGSANYRGSSDVGGWIWGIARLRMARWYRNRGQEPVGMVEEWVPGGRDISHEAVERLDLERMAVVTIGLVIAGLAIMTRRGERLVEPDDAAG